MTNSVGTNTLNTLKSNYLLLLVLFLVLFLIARFSVRVMGATDQD